MPVKKRVEVEEVGLTGLFHFLTSKKTFVTDTAWNTIHYKFKLDENYPFIDFDTYVNFIIDGDTPSGW